MEDVLVRGDDGDEDLDGTVASVGHADKVKHWYPPMQG
jgi:hypothetical protein